MNILTLVVVYDRFANLKRWRRVWRMQPRDGHVVFVRNADEMETRLVRTVDATNEIDIDRLNYGKGCGVVQDVILGRFDGWIPNDWEWLWYATDDFLPMQVDFLEPFRLAATDDNVALVGCRYSENCGPHMRTGGYMIRRDVAEILEWPADPMRDQADGYALEWGSHNMRSQVLAMGFGVTILSGADADVIWDSDHERAMGKWSQIPGEET